MILVVDALSIRLFRAVALVVDLEADFGHGYVAWAATGLNEDFNFEAY